MMSTWQVTLAIFFAYNVWHPQLLPKAQRLLLFPPIWDTWNREFWEIPKYHRDQPSADEAPFSNCYIRPPSLHVRNMLNKVSFGEIYQFIQNSVYFYLGDFCSCRWGRAQLSQKNLQALNATFQKCFFFVLVQWHFSSRNNLRLDIERQSRWIVKRFTVSPGSNCLLV